MTGKSLSWQNPRVLVNLLIVFLAGLIVGAFLMRFGVHGLLHKPQPFWQEGGKQVSLERLTKELDLTPEQQQQLETVLDDFMMYVQMLQAQMDDVRATGKTRVMKILSEDQKRKFERMMGELQARQVP